MNDFLSKLLAGLPQQEPRDMFQNDAYLDPKQLPSPMMSPLQSTQKEVQQPQTTVNPVVQAAIKKIQNKQPVAPAKQNAPEMPEITEEAPAQKSIDLQSLLSSTDELSKAQDDSRDMMSKLLMVKGANQIGAALARQKADDNYVKDFMDLAKAKPQDILTKNKEAREASRFNIDQKKLLFELGDKEKENDPNSDVSKAFREYAKSYVAQAGSSIKIDDRLSMADLQKQMGIIGNAVSAKMAQDARKEVMAMTASAKQEATAEKQSMKNLDFAERQHDRITKSDAYKKITNAEEQLQAAQAALDNPSGVKDIDVLYRVVRGFDPNSAVREGEISLAQQGVSLKQQLELKMSKLGDKPRVIPPEFIKQVLELAKMNKVVAQKQYNRNIGGIIKNAQQRGLSEEDLSMLDPLRDMEQVSSPSQTDPRIDAFMKKNNISNREEAIKILKEAGKL